MIYKVTGKQPNSKMCFVCGLKNKFGLNASFYETDKNELIALCILQSKNVPNFSRKLYHLMQKKLINFNSFFLLPVLIINYCINSKLSWL